MKDTQFEEKGCRGFFDGACAGRNNNCGLGGILFLFDSERVEFKANYGMGTNSRA